MAPIASQAIKSSKWEAFLVCDDKPLRMHMWRDTGNDYWEASVEIRNWPEWSKAKLTLFLDAPAINVMLLKKTAENKIVKLNESEYEVQADDGNRTYRITTSRIESNQNELFLSVYFDRQSFPNIEKLMLFDTDVCSDPIQVKKSSTIQDKKTC